MRPERWELFRWLQTEKAYPDGPHQVAPCHVETAIRLNWRHAEMPIERLLIIGPGTRAEVDDVCRWLKPKYVDVLTALESERAAIEGADLIPQVVAFIGDLHDTRLQTASYDCVFSSNVLEHMVAPLAALLEIRRILKPGGHLYSIVPTFETPSGGYGPFHISCLTLAHWLELMRKAGLRVTDSAAVSEIPFAEREHYYHMYSQAGALPPPYDELFDRLLKVQP